MVKWLQVKEKTTPHGTEAAMAQIFTDNSLSIGRTPLVRLNRVTPGAVV